MTKSKNERTSPRVSKAKGSNERMPKDQMPSESKSCKSCKSK